MYNRLSWPRFLSVDISLQSLHFGSSHYLEITIISVDQFNETKQVLMVY